MVDDIVISVKHITKKYKLYNSPLDRLKEAINPFGRVYHRDYYALDDISFDVKKGDSIGIVGMNGSGKSTLLKLVSGILMPTSGTISVVGKVSALLELGAGFNPEMSGLENIYFNGALNGYSHDEIDNRLDDILAFADIGEFIHQPIRIYSSGMFVRLAFAAAISIDPDILIIDEALSVGDIKFQRKCFSKIEEFMEKRKTILFVSHALETVNLLCNKALLLSNGKLLEQSDPKNITKKFRIMMLSKNIDEVLEYSDSEDRYSIINSTCSSQYSYYELTDNNNDLNKSVSYKLNNWDGSKVAEIIDCGILDENGECVTVLQTGCFYTIYSRVLIYVDSTIVHLGYPIKNAQGLILFATNSWIQKVDMPTLNRGSVLEGRVKIRMWLSPGDYFLGFRAANLDDEFDELHDKIHFIVVGDSKCLRLSVVNLEPEVSISSIQIPLEVLS